MGLVYCHRPTQRWNKAGAVTNKYQLQLEIKAWRGGDDRAAIRSVMEAVKVDLFVEATCELKPKR